jgi:hypothetical protein
VHREIAFLSADWQTAIAASRQFWLSCARVGGGDFVDLVFFNLNFIRGQIFKYKILKCILRKKILVKCYILLRIYDSFLPPTEKFLNLLSDWLEILRGSSKANGMLRCFEILNPYSILNG